MNEWEAREFERGLISKEDMKSFQHRFHFTLPKPCFDTKLGSKQNTNAAQDFVFQIARRTIAATMDSTTVIQRPRLRQLSKGEPTIIEFVCSFSNRYRSWFDHHSRAGHNGRANIGRQVQLAVVGHVTRITVNRRFRNALPFHAATRKYGACNYNRHESTNSSANFVIVSRYIRRIRLIRPFPVRINDR